MGKFTHSYVIVGSTAKDLAVLYQRTGTDAFIFEDERRCCAICDDDDTADLHLVGELTAKAQAVALLGQVLDSSVFVGTVYDRGQPIDEYVDYPAALFGLAHEESLLHLNLPLTPEERATEWGSVLTPGTDTSRLAQLFRRRDEYVFAEDFHTEVLEALGLPSFLAGADYREVERAYETDPEIRRSCIRAVSGPLGW